MQKSASVPILTALSNHRKGQKWTMNGRWKDSPGGRRHVAVPGPGAYTGVSPDSYKYAHSSSYGFGSGIREHFSKDGAPGPGRYDTINSGNNCRTHIAFSFGSSGRSSLAGRSFTPGPGQYKLKGLVGKEGAPLYSCAKRCFKDDMRKRVVPGPGAYSVSADCASPRTPQWTMGSGQRSSSAGGIRNVPGPGAYGTVNTIGVNNSTYKNTPLWSMTSRVYLPSPKNSSDYMCPPVNSFG